MKKVYLLLLSFAFLCSLSGFANSPCDSEMKMQPKTQTSVPCQKPCNKPCEKPSPQAYVKPCSSECFLCTNKNMKTLFTQMRLSETQILKKQADIDIHATMIDNMLENTFRTKNNNDYTIFITFIFCLFIVRGFRTFKNNILFTSLLSSIYLAYFVYEYFMYIYVPPITPIVTMYAVAFLKNIYSIITTDKTTEMLKHAMGKYVSKDVMKKVIADIDKLKLGGTRAVVTILFVDIRNFTQISEKLSPQEVSSILNEYFSTIEPIIGIKCGIEIVDKVKILREKLILEGKPIINIGIGINTGEVFAGNIGTEERLEYTVIGDNVNLAYRIEAYNQILKTQFLISDSTYEFVKDYVDVVKLSQVSIKGKSKPIDIYEVLSIK